jgi:RNA polymerase sigma-70 factor (ECF subfamily)
VPALPRSDGELCAAFLTGDKQAFDELMRRHQEQVFRLVRRYAATPDEARELTQRAFVQAFEAARRTFPRLAATPGDMPFRAWLLRIAINLGKNQVRDEGRWKKTPLEAVAPQVSPTPSAQESLERAEAEALTRRAVAALPKRQREVFTLRIDAGLPFADIAATLGITEGNAKSHFHYAVKRLRDEVNALAGGSP